MPFGEEAVFSSDLHADAPFPLRVRGGPLAGRLVPYHMRVRYTFGRAPL